MAEWETQRIHIPPVNNHESSSLSLGTIKS